MSMIKKNYFPIQEVPSRVKDRVMNKIYGRRKIFRLISLVRYKFILPVLVFVFMLVWWYLYLQIPKHKFIVATVLSGATTTISTSTTVKTHTVVTTTQVIANPPNDETLLQKKLAEAELALNDLSNYVNQEQDITL